MESNISGLEKSGRLQLTKSDLISLASGVITDNLQNQVRLMDGDISLVELQEMVKEGCYDTVDL